jgi:hypothetical protein
MMASTKGVVVAGLMEDGLVAIAAVEHVIRHAANRGSGSSWHATILKYHPRTLKINYVPFLPTVPFLPPDTAKPPKV